MYHMWAKAKETIINNMLYLMCVGEVQTYSDSFVIIIDKTALWTFCQNSHPCTTVKGGQNKTTLSPFKTICDWS